MFGMDEKKKEMKEGLLEKLIDHLMGMPDEGSDDEEKSETPELEKLEGEEGEKLEEDGKPKMEMKVLEVKAKPKFKIGDSEMEDESLEDILKRKAKA